MTSSIILYTFNGVPDIPAKSVTTTIAGATFTDGAVLSGTWTATYDARGNLLDQVSGRFTVTGPAGSATFTAAGTLPYANSAAATSYEIHFMVRTGTGYDGLYVNWKGETPSTLAPGTPFLYTSVRGTDSLFPLRLSDGGCTVAPATCFLSGTGLHTPDGEAAVETLQVGDLVSVQRDGVLVSETIRWVGSRSVDRADGIVPVRIRTDAFAPGVPHADLLVTPEHCVLVDGVLVPARMLVNDASIVADTDVTRFTFHHVELERHGILLAEGLTTESYLDTGNRGNFAGGSVVSIRPDVTVDPTNATWQTDACAPLHTDRETVEPIWRRLAARAAECGIGMLLKPIPARGTFSDDPMLRLLLDDNSLLELWSREPGRAIFWVPEGRTPVSLVSRASSPDVVIGPFVDDRRLLGVKVGGLLYGEALTAVEVVLGSLPSFGWHAVEPDGRWTNGAGALDLPPARYPATMLIVTLAATLRYVADGEVTRAVA